MSSLNVGRRYHSMISSQRSPACNRKCELHCGQTAVLPHTFIRIRQCSVTYLLVFRHVGVSGVNGGAVWIFSQLLKMMVPLWSRFPVISAFLIWKKTWLSPACSSKISYFYCFKNTFESKVFPSTQRWCFIHPASYSPEPYPEVLMPHSTPKKAEVGKLCKKTTNTRYLWKPFKSLLLPLLQWPNFLVL